MSAQERLAAALRSAMTPDTDNGWATAPYYTDEPEVMGRLAARLLAADPPLAQAIEDGTELALLEAALPEGWVLDILWQPGWTVEAWERGRPHNGVNAGAPSPVLAEAARACREALEARKGPEGGA